MTICWFPGLGFDCRIFDNVMEYLPSAITHIQVNWINPIDINEEFSDYIKRVSLGIPEEYSEPLIFIGHSFGSIAAMEISRIRSNVSKVIIISSIKSRTENTKAFKAAAPTKAWKLFNKEMVLQSFRFWAKQHGYDSEEAKALFTDMVQQHSNLYLQWALRNLSLWDGDFSELDNLYHLHGSNDKTFPIKNIGAPFDSIEDGDHFMVFNKAETIAEKILSKISTQ